MIIIQTPLRVSFFGGGTDFPSFYKAHGGCVLSSAIDKFIFVIIKRRFDDKLRVGYTTTEMVDSRREIKHELIREAFCKTGIKKGVEVTTMGDIPSAGSGLGSSSTVTVGTLHAMYSLLGDLVSVERLAREACEIEIDTLGKPIGIQDQYIAAYGGLRIMEFSKNGQVHSRKISIDAATKRRLFENLLLFYTGITRKSDAILVEQTNNIRNRIEILNEMKAIAYQASEELESGRLDQFGRLLHDTWQLKKQLASQISTNSFDDIYCAARSAGAIGGKITGAGGGGFMLIYCPKERQEAVREVLKNMQELPMRSEADGTKVIFNYQR